MLGSQYAHHVYIKQQLVPGDERRNFAIVTNRGVAHPTPRLFHEGRPLAVTKIYDLLCQFKPQIDVGERLVHFLLQSVKKFVEILLHVILTQSKAIVLLLP